MENKTAQKNTVNPVRDKKSEISAISNGINKKTIKGVVVSNKMEKTLVVLTKRFVKHPKYGKYQTVEKKYKAHYDEGEYNVGDEVTIQECNPISKEKRFRIVESS